MAGKMEPRSPEQLSIRRIDIGASHPYDCRVAKTEQLQLRVSAEQKRRIKAQAARAGEDVSKWVLGRLLPAASDELQRLIDRLSSNPSAQSLALAEIHDFLHASSAQKLETAIQDPDLARLDAWASNYFAAMVEYACARKHAPAPKWVWDVPPLPTPWFASRLVSLRLHLLASSPPPFRRRNLFIDSTLGARV